MARTAPIVFSHATALQILRRLPPEMLEQRSRLRQWPQHPVSLAQLDAAVSRVEELFPAPIETRPSDANGRAFDSSMPADVTTGIIPLRRPIHFITGCAGQNRRRGMSVCHLTRQPINDRCVIRLDDGIFACCPELAFIQMAAGLGSTAILELGFELCGTYRTAKTEAPAAHNIPPITSTKKLKEFASTASQQPGIRKATACELCGTYRTAKTEAPAAHNIPPITSTKKLKEFASTASQQPGIRKATACLKYLCDNSASARESALAILLELPLRDGGYALGTPRMNAVVASTETTQQIYRAQYMKCDIAWPDSKVDVEYQSRYAHEGETARIRDSRRANALGELGWTVISVTNEELNSLQACNAIASRVIAEQTPSENSDGPS